MADSRTAGSRVPNGWGDPSTERHLQVPPRHATGSRAAKDEGTCGVCGKPRSRCRSESPYHLLDPHATPDRAARFHAISEGLQRQAKEDLDAIQAILDDAYHDHTEQSDRTVAALTRHMAQRIYLWCQDRYE